MENSSGYYTLFSILLKQTSENTSQNYGELIQIAQEIGNQL